MGADVDLVLLQRADDAVHSRVVGARISMKMSLS